MKDKTHEPFEKPSMGVKKNYLLRVPADKELMDLIAKGIAALNEGGYMEVTAPSFARQALRYYAQQCITKQVGLAFKPKENGKKHKLQED